MKEIILLQNSVAFSVDINQLYSPQEHNVYLIVNQASFNKLKERYQDKLFSKIFITDDFNFNTIANIVSDIIKDVPKENVRIATNSEWCVALCGQLRESFGVSGLDMQTATNFTNKLEMKKALTTSGIRMPKHVAFEEEVFSANPTEYVRNVISKVGLPIFAKPIDDANSHFTCKINSEEEFLTWAKNKESGKKFELDEFISGTLYHIDTLHADGQICFSQVCEYAYPPFEFMQNKTLGSITLPDNHPDVSALLDFNKKVLEALNYQGSGATHLEVFKTNQGELIFLEIAARAGGAWLPKIYKKYLNINLFEVGLLAQISDNLQVPLVKGPFSAALWYPFMDGEVNIHSLPPIKSSFVLETNVRNGEKTQQSKNAREIAANIFLWNNDFETLYQDFCLLKNYNLLYRK